MIGLVLTLAFATGVALLLFGQARPASERSPSRLRVDRHLRLLLSDAGIEQPLVALVGACALAGVVACAIAVVIAPLPVLVLATALAGAWAPIA